MKRRDTRGAVFYTAAELRLIRALLEDGDEAGAQQIILDKLIRVVGGPRTRATMRPGDRRKRLVKV